MKKNKSLLLLFVLLLSTMLVLGACGGSDKSESSDSKSAGADSKSDANAIEEKEMSEEEKAALLETLTPPIGGTFEDVVFENGTYPRISVYSEDMVIDEVSAWYVDKLASLDFVDKKAIDKAEEEKRNQEKLENNPDVNVAPAPEVEPGADANGEAKFPDEFDGYIQGQRIVIDLVQNTGWTFGGDHAGKKEVVISFSWK